MVVTGARSRTAMMPRWGDGIAPFARQDLQVQEIVAVTSVHNTQQDDHKRTRRNKTTARDGTVLPTHLNVHLAVPHPDDHPAGRALDGQHAASSSRTNNLEGWSCAKIGCFHEDGRLRIQYGLTPERARESPTRQSHTLWPDARPAGRNRRLPDTFDQLRVACPSLRTTL